MMTSAKAFRDSALAKMQAATDRVSSANPDEASVAVSVADCFGETGASPFGRLDEIAKQGRGPHTDAGKRASSANSMKHGLSGSGKFLPPALRAEVDRLEVAFRDEFQPEGEFEDRAVRDLALASARKERCFALEAELLETRRLRDLATFEVDRQLAAEKLGAKLSEAPVLTVLELRRTAAGRDWLIRQWGLLLEGIQPDKCYWINSDFQRALELQGVGREKWHLDLKTRMLQSFVAQAQEPDPERVAQACRALGSFITTAIADLERDLPVLVAIDERERDLLESDLHFDASPEVEKLRRLGRDAERLYQRSLRDLRQRDRKTNKAGEIEPNEPTIVAQNESAPVIAAVDSEVEVTAQNEFPDQEPVSDLAGVSEVIQPEPEITPAQNENHRAPQRLIHGRNRHHKAPKRLLEERAGEARAQRRETAPGQNRAA